MLDSTFDIGRLKLASPLNNIAVHVSYCKFILEFTNIYFKALKNIAKLLFANIKEIPVYFRLYEFGHRGAYPFDFRVRICKHGCDWLTVVTVPFIGQLLRRIKLNLLQMFDK